MTGSVLLGAAPPWGSEALRPETSVLPPCTQQCGWTQWRQQSGEGPRPTMGCCELRLRPTASAVPAGVLQQSLVTVLMVVPTVVRLYVCDQCGAWPGSQVSRS